MFCHVGDIHSDIDQLTGINRKIASTATAGLEIPFNSVYVGEVIFEKMYTGSVSFIVR